MVNKYRPSSQVVQRASIITARLVGNGSNGFSEKTSLMTTGQAGAPSQSKFGPHLARDAIDPGPLVAECSHRLDLPTEIGLMGSASSVGWV